MSFWEYIQKSDHGHRRHGYKRSHRSERIDWTPSVIEYNFTKVECHYFVPVPDQTATNKKHLRCHCGDIYNDHAPVKSIKRRGLEKEDVFETIVHRDLQSYLRNRQSIAPIPVIEWSRKTALKTNNTDSYGKINFKDGDKKPAKYIRVGINDSPQDVLDFMIKEWKIMKPTKPELVIYVTGGAKNFKLPNKTTKRLHDAIINIADSTSAWLITSGFSVGLMKLVGEAVRDGQTFSFDDETGRAMHNIKCIGIGPWGNVLNSDSLRGTRDYTLPLADRVFRTVYKKEKVSPESYKPLPLDSNVTHFVLVDNGFRNRHTGPGSVNSFVAAFLNLLTTHEQHPMNLVTVMVNGGKSVFDDIQHSIHHNIPVVICEGTERAADVFADAYWHSNEQGEMSVEYVKRLEERIQKIESNWHSASDKEHCMKVVIECCKKKHLITIFDIRKVHELDTCLLQAVIKGKKHSWDRYYHFNLAFACNKAEFAETELLTQTISFRKHYLVEKLTEAIVSDKCDFVKLLLKQDIDLVAYLTRDRLTQLYNDSLKCGGLSNHLCRLLRITNDHKAKDYTLGDIGRLLDKLIYRYDKSVYCDIKQPIIVDQDEIDHPKRMRLKKITANKLKAARSDILYGKEPPSNDKIIIKKVKEPIVLTRHDIWHSLANAEQDVTVSRHKDSGKKRKSKNKFLPEMQPELGESPQSINAWTKLLMKGNVPSGDKISLPSISGSQLALDAVDEISQSASWDDDLSLPSITGSDPALGTGDGISQSASQVSDSKPQRRSVSDDNKDTGNEVVPTKALPLQTTPTNGAKGDAAAEPSLDVDSKNEPTNQIDLNTKLGGGDIQFIDSEGETKDTDEIEITLVNDDNTEKNVNRETPHDANDEQEKDDIDESGDAKKDSESSEASPSHTNQEGNIDSGLVTSVETEKDSDLFEEAKNKLALNLKSRLSKPTSALTSPVGEDEDKTFIDFVENDEEVIFSIEMPQQKLKRRKKTRHEEEKKNQDEPEKLTKADRELFIWAILNNRPEMARYFWEYSVQPISTALVGALLCRKILKEMPDADADLIASYNDMKQYFEKVAKESLDAMAEKYPDKAMEMLEQKVSRWNNLNCMQIASGAECRDFVGCKTSQAYLKNKWRGNNIKYILCLPMLSFPVLHAHQIRQKSRECRSKMLSPLHTRMSFMQHVHRQSFHMVLLITDG